MKATRLIRLWLTAVLLLLTGLGSVANLRAHEIRPALLNITEQKPGWFEVTWKVPMRGGRVLSVKPVLPSGLVPLGPPSSHTVPGANIQYSTYKLKPYQNAMKLHISYFNVYCYVFITTYHLLRHSEIEETELRDELLSLPRVWSGLIYQSE